MKTLPIKPQVDTLIIQWFDMMRVGEPFINDYAVNYVMRHIRGKKPSRETVRRYIRLLREKDHINYDCECKFKRNMRILEIGQPHSI